MTDDDYNEGMRRLAHPARMSDPNDASRIIGLLAVADYERAGRTTDPLQAKGCLRVWLADVIATVNGWPTTFPWPSDLIARPGDVMAAVNRLTLTTAAAVYAGHMTRIIKEVEHGNA